MNFSFFSRTLLILVTAVGLQLQAAEPPHIVIMIGEDEYQTWETLPEFAVKELKAVPYRVTIIHADAADKNQFPGFVEAMHDADLLFISVRRRTPSVEVIDAVPPEDVLSINTPAQLAEVDAIFRSRQSAAGKG